MKRLAMALTVSMLATGVAGCGSSTPTNPSTFKVFTVQLLPANENPPVTNTEQSGRGTAVVTIHSELTSRAGVAGRIERFVSTRFLRRVYAQELQKLNDVAQEASG